MHKPSFLTTAKIIIKPKISCLCILGKGDPIKTFDVQIAKILDWMKTNNVQRNKKPTFGIYYNHRKVVGVKNVVWEACVPIDQIIKTSPFIAKIIPEKNVVSTRLQGSYSRIGDAIEYLESYSKQHEIFITWPLLEVYIHEGKNPITDIQLLIESDQ